MKYEVYEDLSDPRGHVEGFDEHGRSHLTNFSGPEARERAEEYAGWISRRRKIINQAEQCGRPSDIIGQPRAGD
jgi:hypothetical protein